MKTVVICGKGGIGKSTITANLAVLMQNGGSRVLQVGCDPKHDSCSPHLDRAGATVMDTFAARGRIGAAELRDLVVLGRTGVSCIEIGGPQPGVGCAGRAISLVLEFLSETPDIYSRFDVRLFDLVGDVVCGGFAAPMRTGADTQIYIVVSGELLPLYAANNIARGIVNLARRGGGRLAGLIANLRGTPGERDVVNWFAGVLGTRVVGWLPRDRGVLRAEMERRTVVERFPDSDAARALADIRDRILACASEEMVLPHPVSDEELQTRCLGMLAAQEEPCLL